MRLGCWAVVEFCRQSIQEVTSRTLARQTDKNGEQRGREGPKLWEWEECRSRGESEKPRQNWRIRQT